MVILLLSSTEDERHKKHNVRMAMKNMSRKVYRLLFLYKVKNEVVSVQLQSIMQTYSHILQKIGSNCFCRELHIWPHKFKKLISLASSYLRWTKNIKKLNFVCILHLFRMFFGLANSHPSWSFFLILISPQNLVCFSFLCLVHHGEGEKVNQRAAFVFIGDTEEDYDNDDAVMSDHSSDDENI